MQKQLSAASLASVASSADMITSLGQLNATELNEYDIEQAEKNGDSSSVRERLNKRFGLLSVTQRNLTLEETTSKPPLVWTFDHLI